MPRQGRPREAPMGDRDDWEPFLERLDAGRRFGRTMGGEARVERQRSRGRHDVRSRLAALCDPDSFRELGLLAGGADPAGAVAADGFVCGVAALDGRDVCVGAEDFTAQGGSIGIAGMTKRERIARMARDERVPLVSLLEGSGARVGKMLERYVPVPTDLTTLADLSGVVPTVGVVLGPSAGHGALTAAMADFVVMVRGTSSIFSAGPPLVKAALGEDVTTEQLGGSAVHCDVSGVAQLAVDSEAEAFAAVRRYLSYLPSSAWCRSLVLGPDEGLSDVGERRVDELLDIIPPNARRPYDVTAVIGLVFDAGSVFEVSPTFARSIVTALARIGGHAVAVVANQPNVRAGAVDASAADKAARFLAIAGSFHLPVVFLADNPGVLAGSVSERNGILRASARMFAAQHRLSGPKIHVTLRKAFGFGSPVMGMNQF